MSVPHAISVWDAPDRDAAIAAALASHGIDGSKIMESADPDGPQLAPSDLAMLIAHPFGQAWLEAVPVMFAQGLEGYADDRIADGPGWMSFDVGEVACPVVVLHGAADIICDPIHARHTAEIVPGAELRLVPDLGHFSIFDEIVPTLRHALALG
jgi:pimeloyl-ACP methyl ester carboxylesterase